MKLLLAASTLLGSAGLLFAADHVDSPKVVDDPATDITDLYAWMTPDGGRVVLAMSISAASFAPGIQYVFHVGSAPAYGEAQTVLPVICAFDDGNNVTCWVSDQDFVSGFAQNERGITSESSRIRVFTGLREDAFFFNAAGFSTTMAAVKQAAGSLTFDAAGCPALTSTIAGALGETLARGTLGAEPRDFFVGPVATIVIEVDKAMLTPGGPILGVWASTRR